MSDFLFPFLQWAGVMAALVAGFVALEFGLHSLTDRLTSRSAGDGGP